MKKFLATSILALLLGFVSHAQAVPIPNAPPAERDGDYRSKGTGFWRNLDAPTIWQRRVGGVWQDVPVGTWPTNADGTIYIATGTTITIRAAGQTVYANEVNVLSGGTLILNPDDNSAANAANLVKSGNVYDLVIWGGGTLVVSTEKDRSQYFAFTPIANVPPFILFKSGSTFRFDDRPAKNLGADWEDFGSLGMSNWETGSVFQWNSNRPPVFAGRTYFPNTVPNNMTSAIPILRITKPTVTVAAESGELTVNGRLDLWENLTLSTPGYDKYFRNGIIGRGTLTFNVGTANTNKIEMDGVDVQLGGGSIVTNQKVEIGGANNPCTVTMISNKTITGTSSTVRPGQFSIVGTAPNPTRVLLGANNLTYTGAGGMVTASPYGYIVTDGTGEFRRDVSTAGNYLFPIGNAANYQKAEISFGAANAAGTILGGRFITGAAGHAGLPLTEKDDFLPYTSNYGYWQMNAASTVASTYTGAFTGRFPGILDFSKLHMVKRPNGGSWMLDGTHVTTTGSNAEFVLQRTGMAGFSEFAAAGNAVALPVKFDNISAILSGGNLLVNWSSLTEQDALRYDVYLSKDGINFKKIGSVNSTAPDGNSNAKIDYKFRIPMSSAAAVLGISLFGMLFGFKRGRKKVVYLAIALFSIGMIVAACNKNAAEAIQTGKHFVKVVSVDKNGHEDVSSVVKVIHE